MQTSEPTLLTTIETLIDEGDYEAARAALDKGLKVSLNGPSLLLLFQVRARLEDFDGAVEAMRSLVVIEPELAAPMDVFRLCVESERTAAARRIDPAIAGKRAAIRPPPAFCLSFVKAAVMSAQGQHDDVKRAIEEGRAEVPAVSGSLTRASGEVLRFVDISDADHVTGPFLPCFDDGAVLDVPYCDLLSIEILEASISLDNLWAPARFILRDGGELQARVPVLYSGSGRHGDARVRTGEVAAWDHERGYTEGSGQRSLRLSLEGGATKDVGLRGVTRIDLDAPGGLEAGVKMFQSRMGW